MLLRYNSVSYLILNIAILLPLFPKISLNKNIYINPVEIVLFFYILISLFLFKKNILFKHPLQRYLIFVFIIEIFFSIISFANFFDLVGLLKLAKYIMYISVFYIGYIYLKFEDLRKIISIGIISMIINIIFFIYNISINGFSIWQIKNLSSGFVNRYIDFTTMSFSTIPSGAHAIWSDYCVFIFVLSISLFYLKKISYLKLLLVTLLVLINLLISVARTSLLTFFIFIFLSFMYHIIILKKINKRILSYGFFVVLLLIMLVINFYDSLPLMKKVIYTLNSFFSYGEESNITARLQIWILSLYSLFLNPLYILIGSGYNKVEFLNRINEANLHFNFSKYPGVPESFYLESLMYGGIIALILLFIFSFLVVYYTLSQRNILSKYFGFFFIAEIIVNLISGSIMRSDLVFFHILLLLGFIARIKDEKKYFIHNS